MSLALDDVDEIKASYLFDNEMVVEIEASLIVVDMAEILVSFAADGSTDEIWLTIMVVDGLAMMATLLVDDN